MKAFKHLAICAAVLGSMAFTAAVQAQTRWTLAYVALPGTIYQDVALAVPDRIAKATGGKLLITANSSIVPGTKALEGVRDGLVQMSLLIPAFYTGSLPLLTVTSIPGISESYDDLNALSKSTWGEQVRALYSGPYNSHQVLQSAFCPQTLFSTVPIRTIDEWSGRKLRVNNRGMGLMGKELGATTVSLSTAEVLPALERGVIEGVITDSCWALGAGFNAVVKHAADWRLGSVLPAPLLVNKDAWAALPADVRAAATAEFAAMEKEFEQKWRVRVKTLPKSWADAGVVYTQVSAAETARAYDNRYVSKVIDAWKEDMKRVGLDADKTLAIARVAVKK